jgi:hypothetical protein
VGRQRRQFQERRAGVEEPLDPLAGQEFAPGEVLVPHAFRAARGGGIDLRLEVGDDRLHAPAVFLRLVGVRVMEGRQRRERRRHSEAPMS